MSLKESTLLNKQTFYESPQEQPDCQWALDPLGYLQQIQLPILQTL